jgi:D-beta-D-heptose 7-phosphate kinase/D-beta-D-heptose 1-phosphate adenosyltransferase
MRGRLVVVGDALLDRDIDGRVERLCPEAPVPVLDEEARRARPGGAAFAAALAAADGCPVTLVTALGRDRPGRELATLLAGADLEVVDVGLHDATPVKTRFRCDGRLLLRVDAPAPVGTVGDVTGAASHAIAKADAVLVSDYGRGLAAEPRVRDALAAARGPVVWDPHPRGPAPVARVRLVTPNRSEAAQFAPGAGDVSAQARALLRRWRADAVAVTLGRDGAVLAYGEGAPVRVPGRAADGDPCGAGDRFASAVAAALADAARLPDAVAQAVASASAFVGDGGAAAFACDRASPEEPEADIDALTARVRAAGGRVVATGGCFDILHAGHVAMLEAARALGDCLVVCLNSDESVRRGKGPDRPLVPEEDRAAVLAALASVDAVVVFDEDTPETVLEGIRPDVWAKGGDYALDELPEADVVARWGGEAVILPYVEGRSTTRLLEDLAVRALR